MRVTPHTTRLGSLRRLSEADFEVAPHEHDVRGWKVVLANDESIGKVDDLIIDPAAEKARYLDVDVDRKAMQLERDRHVLIPISDAQLDPVNKVVVLGRMTRTALMQLPEDVKSFDAAYDTTYRSHLSDKEASKRMTRSAEELRISKRVEKQGEVRVSKHVETERVRQDVPLSREEVRVERRPVKDGATPRSEFGNDEIVVPVMGEEAVIEKRPVVKEEIVISKEPITEHQAVETDVRRERVDVDRSGERVRLDERGKGPGGR